MVCHVVVTLHCSYGCHVALLARWPLYLGVRRGWRRAAHTYLNVLDVAHLPHCLHYPHGHAGSVTWLWQVVGVVIHVCREGCGWLVAVVAVGETGEAVGPVGVDGGGGWNEMSVGGLLIVDDNNKSSVGVCRHLLWV